MGSPATVTQNLPCSEELAKGQGQTWFIGTAPCEAETLPARVYVSWSWSVEVTHQGAEKFSRGCG